MKKILWSIALALTCWMAGPAQAGKVTLSTGASCDFTTMTMTSGGSVSVTCVDVAIVTPVPPVITPPVVPVVGCGPLPQNVIMTTPSTAGRDKELMTPGVGVQAPIFSLALPTFPAGNVATTRQPATPPSMQMRIFISKCPGDTSYSASPAAQFKYSWWPVPYFPCMAPGSAESASIWWAATARDQNTCVVTPGTWYVNMQASDGQGNNTCTTPGGCPFIFRYNPN